MASLRPIARVLCFAMLAGACRSTPRAEATAASASAPPKPVTSVPATSPSGAAASMRPSPAPSAAPRAAGVALDEAGLRTAKAYLAELGHGRKATAAKDFAAADVHFSRCLEHVPGDGRALAERGYERLLARRLPEAEADLAAAARAAPSSAVLLQIAHSRLLVARERGDEAAVKRFEDEKKRLNAARRLPAGVSCTREVRAGGVDAELVETLAQAFERMRAAHATEDKTTPASIRFGEAPTNGVNQAEQLTALAARGPLPQGGWEVWSFGNLAMNHALISRDGRLYVLPHLSTGNAALCGLDGAAEVTVGGGGTQPWHVRRVYREMVRGYGGGDDAPAMGFCSWASTRLEVTVFDATTFHGLRTLDVSARPSSDSASASEPEHLLELEWQPEHVVMEACGKRELVPYAPDR